ncbi:unnamed protein product [Leptosia nina]|uniref:DH domain-containing protein n=1 Tax=Leptosia nina TaxID=320188 RepID=A0AAV1JLA7_9NEOP
MEGTNADSDHSMTWEDFFGSTTDLTPTLIGIYDALLEPAKSLRPEAIRLETAKDARNDPPLLEAMTEKKDNEDTICSSPPKDPAKIIGGVKLPIASLNASSLYNLRTKNDCGVSDKRGIPSDDKTQKTFKETKTDAFDNLSPNVKRMLSSASQTTTLRFQKKTTNITRSSIRKCNIPLVGATSKISQSGVEILSSVDVYDQPSALKSPHKQPDEKNESPQKLAKPIFKIDEPEMYDVPKNNQPAIYDVPNSNKTAFESLSLPYIDQSIELSISANDREFDIKLSSKDNSPLKPEITSTPQTSPIKFPNESMPRKESKASKHLLKSDPYPQAVGSTGNLRPEKEMIRLNPPIQVTRPLSMSSIASSSSTSSSGVQNKGGVNSAYLASIESLDDHSDADLTSGNGSNIFMNSAGMLKTSISEESRTETITRQNLEELSGLSQLERVCAEIVQTENVYVEDLRQVVEGYLHVWRRDSTFSEDELSELFNNIEDIYAFNKSLCAELNSCQLDATCIARCFVNNTTGFSVYTSYCTGYPRTMERLAALASKPQSAREFREKQVELSHSLPLASYLLKPVQRILKYHLLLQNVVKQCASRETEYALLKMTGIAQHIDDMKRRHEHAVRVQEIQSLLYGWNGPDLTTYGELCAEGTFRVFGAKAMRHAFLFDKMLLVTKNRDDGILAYKSHIMCNNMMLVESIAGAPLSFHVIPWDAPRAQLTLQARSQRHKREWTLLLKRVILENYNAVIPSHARQLVMELGQNKTDDDILAEKSHNLITQASMRKQLSAPEYLEKRKLERERRKSFENGRGRAKKSYRKTIERSSRSRSQDCDCAQVSAEKGMDYTCDNCYIDLCSDCEMALAKDKRGDKCDCQNVEEDKCPECDRSLHFIDSGSVEDIERKPTCKCSDFKSSQESFCKEFKSLNKTRNYHSSDNIVGYDTKNKDNIPDLTTVKIQKTCLKCAKIKENIPVTDSMGTLQVRKSRYVENDKTKTDTLRSKSKDDPHRAKLSKIGTWRRKSEPGLQQNSLNLTGKKSLDSDNERNDDRNDVKNDKIEFECRNCGSNKISKKLNASNGNIHSDVESDNRKYNVGKQSLEIKMYNTKNIPKKISKIKKNRAKGRLTTDTSTRFYADFSSDLSTENILHISESNDSLNIDKSKVLTLPDKITTIPDPLPKDEDIDEETYKKLIEKTDSFKKNELEKEKYLNKQNIICEGSETDEKPIKTQNCQEDIQESCEENEQPLEQIISQLLMQNREFQKLLKKQQLRSSAQKRHHRLLKSHSIPDQVLLNRNEDMKLKPKYGRQMSEDLQLSIKEDIDNNKDDLDKGIVSEDDHIYETLRVENRVNRNPDILDSKISSSSVLKNKNIDRKVGPESDYVYLSFEEIKKGRDSLDDGIYDVPVKTPEKVIESQQSHKSTDYYVTMENQRPATGCNENYYDNLEDVCRRKKEVPNTLPSDYMPMSTDHQSPNTPEIWISRQKEHFTVSRDRKSGSLPRSFQVPTSVQDEHNLSTFKFKPNSNSKTYLNRDGKVMSIDRPFTIASDQSEISYDDVETYMSEGDILKFTKSAQSVDEAQNFSKSTLELEEEIDRCYKNNFEKIDLDTNKNESILKTSGNNLDISVTSSCEGLIIDQSNDKAKMDVIHPEHKIYKPNGNALSLKNVLSRFKNRSPPKNEDIEINANEPSSNENKADIKSPTNEKRSALNPRSYSKNLLQRFRSIIGDEHSDDNQNKIEANKIIQGLEDDNITVDVTSIDKSSPTSINCSVTDVLSRSVCENTTISESQNEKNNLDTLSQSCHNLTQKPAYRPSYEKSISMMSSIPNSTCSSPSKTNANSLQSLKKLPIYMQGSKHLGARIAQSDYVDPMTLLNERNVNHINVLINKNAIRPDSLFSNSSFVTSSSESTLQETQKHQVSEISSETSQVNSDESYYEKSFEKIEHFTDEDVFRDSAVYSDQEDVEDKEVDRTKRVTRLNRVDSVTRDSMKSKKIVSSITEISSIQTVSFNKIQNTVKKYDNKTGERKVKPKTAPPVPAKPKISQGPISTVQRTIVSNSRNFTKNVEKTSSTESSTSVNTRTIQRNVKQSLVRSESTPFGKSEEKVEKTNITSEFKGTEGKTSIQMKRLGFERASLDSATRKRPVENKRTSTEQPKTSKSVLERRLELEQLTKPQKKPTKQPLQAIKPKSITMKVASFETAENTEAHTANNKNIPDVKPSGSEDPNDDPKGSWVKQVVNKFQ